MTAAHLRSCQNDQMSIVAYTTVMNFLKDYVVEFCRSYFELVRLFGTKKLLGKIDYKLLEAKILLEGHVEEPELGYVYLQRKTNKKYFFRVLDINLVPSKIIQKFIANAAMSDAPKHVKNKFINRNQRYLEVRN